MRQPANPFAHPHGVLVFGHRGERGHYPENSMLSLQQAVAAGVDALEIDVHMTADGHIVVIHDDTTDRTTSGQGRVSAMTLAELQSHDAGYRFTPDGGQTFPFRGQGLVVPTLAEVFATFPNLWINIDLKQHDLRMIEPFVRLLHEQAVLERVVVGSFDGATLAAFRHACPQVPTAASEAEVRRLVVLSKLGLGRFYRGQAQMLQIPEFHGRIRLVTRRFVHDAHRHNMAVHVWTVNETEEMARLVALGVDGIVSDYPRRLLHLLGR